MQVIQSFSDVKAEKTAVTIGMFDGLHRGHHLLLNKLIEKSQVIGAKSLVITFCESPKLLFQPQADIRYLSPYQEKIKLFQSLDIDYLLCIPFDKTFANIEAEDLIKELLIKTCRMKYFLMGYDNKIGKNRAGDYHYVQTLSEKYAFELEQAPSLSENGIHISSTSIRAFLSESKIDLANQFLGYSYFVKGKVINGLKIGRKIDFPTANIQLPKAQLLPQKGVYAVQLLVNHQIYQGMANVGTNPSVNADNHLKLEVHLFGFQSDLYDKEVQVHFLKHLRSEQKFPNLEALKAQLVLDKQKSLDYFANLPK